VAQRLDRAEELLETTDLGVEEVAGRVGFGSAAVLRERFGRRRGTSPRAYRRTFARAWSVRYRQESRPSGSLRVIQRSTGGWWR
jgi:AraC-like DNA-binding protein